MARIASRRGAGGRSGSGGGDSIVPLLIRNRHSLFAASFLVLAALAAFVIRVTDDPAVAVALISAGLLDAIGENATAVGSSSAAAGDGDGGGSDRGDGGSGLHSVRGAASARGSTETATTDTNNAETNDEATGAAHKVAGPNGLSRTTYDGPPDDSANAGSRDVRYYELPDPNFNKRDHHLPMRSSHTYSTVIDRAPWFDSGEICKSTCCARRIAVSIDHEAHRIKNTVDGLDMADVIITGHRIPGHLEFRPAELTHDIVPCLQDGTIIHIDSYGHTVIKFFETMRPNITDGNVRYVLMTTETDGPQPMGKYRKKLTDDAQLLKWYGNNPNLLVSKPPPTDVELSKFVGFPLGLSKQHAQMPYLQYYLSARNHTNPFADKSRWTESTVLFDPANKETTDVMFVKFGINARSQHRRVPYDMACNGRTRNATDDISCTLEGQHTMHETYSAASRYLFGLSPRGNGEDCYRTYELLLLGVIPVIVDRYGFTKEGGMLEDLPAVVLDNWDLNQEQLLAKLRDYIRSEEFLSTDFQRGWERLFLGYWRRRVLRDAGREDDILVHPESGRTYYLAWQYYEKKAEESNR